MELIFTKKGDYRDGKSILVVTQYDVNFKKIFNVYDKDAEYYINNGCAVKPHKYPKREDVLGYETKVKKSFMSKLNFFSRK